MLAMNINKHYSFSVYGNSYLGQDYKNYKLLSILDYHTALKFSNVVLLNRQIFPYLPQGTPSDPTKYTYYLFKHKDQDIVIADVWIIPSSITEATGVNYTLTLNNITATQMAVIRDQLRLLGISFDIV